jgi:hypothetical protein
VNKPSHVSYPFTSGIIKIDSFGIFVPVVYVGFLYISLEPSRRSMVKQSRKCSLQVQWVANVPFKKNKHGFVSKLPPKCTGESSFTK